MKRIKNFRLATQGITAVLLFGIAFAAGAEQMMRALPAPAATQPVAALPAVQQIAAPAAARPAPPMSQMKLLPADSPTSVKRPAVGGLSDATKTRLKSAGLDAADPGLATKLQAKLRETEASFRGAHASSVRIVPKKPQLSSARSVGGGAPAGAASSAFGPPQGAGPGGSMMSGGPGVATFVDLYSGDGGRVTSINKGDSFQYVALVFSPKMIGEPEGSPTISFSECGFHVGRGAVIANGTANGHNLPVKNPANGKWYYWVTFSFDGFDFGAKPRDLMISMDLGKLGQGSFSIPAFSRTVTATITLTVDSVPPFVTNNNFGIGKSNGLFTNSGVTRLDPGTNPNAATSGDDNVGVAVNLGPGWSVTGAKIIAAHSVLDAPNDSLPDNSYRGATVTQLPSSGRLQTTVHWHYGPAESLSYTIEWKLQGPGGQRPLMTMPLGGSCDS